MEKTKGKSVAADVIGDEAVQTVDEAVVSAIEAAVEKALAKAVEAAVDTAVDKMIATIKEMQAVQSPTAVSVTLNGAVSGETGRETPDSRVDFSKLSYSELCEFMEKHPTATI